MDLIEFKLDANDQLTDECHKVWSEICSRILVSMKINVTELHLIYLHCTWDHFEDFSQVVYVMSVCDDELTGIHHGYLYCTYSRCHKTNQLKLTRIALGLVSGPEVSYNEDAYHWQYITTGVQEDILSWEELIKNN